MRAAFRVSTWVLCLVLAGAAVSKAQEAGAPVAPDYVLNTVPTEPVALVGIAPCRLADTRASQGFPDPFGAPSLAALTPRVFPVAGYCGIPNTAQAVVINVTVANPADRGWISLWPGGDPIPFQPTSRLNYAAGQTIANTTVEPLGATGDITVYARVATDLVLDVSGYFDQGPGGTITGVTAGSGLAGGGFSGTVTLSADTTVMQARVAGSCPTGQYIRAIDEVGAVTCEVDADTLPAGTPLNTPGAIVQRDGAGGFAAGTVALAGNLDIAYTSASAGMVTQAGVPLMHTAGNMSVFVGHNAGDPSTGPSNNTAVGTSVLRSSSGSNNSALGTQALYSNTTGQGNNAFGHQALYYNTEGSYNVAIGRHALLSNTTGITNVAIGSSAMTGSTEGSQNVAIGNGASGGTQIRPLRDS